MPQKHAMPSHINSTMDSNCRPNCSMRQLYTMIWKLTSTLCHAWTWHEGAAEQLTSKLKQMVGSTRNKSVQSRGLKKNHIISFSSVLAHEGGSCKIWVIDTTVAMQEYCCSTLGPKFRLNSPFGDQFPFFPRMKPGSRLLRLCQRLCQKSPFVVQFTKRGLAFLFSLHQWLLHGP